jgi:hypothetical protein
LGWNRVINACLDVDVDDLLHFKPSAWLDTDPDLNGDIMWVCWFLGVSESKAIIST